MTIAMGRRFVIVEGVERWKDAEVTAHLAPVLKGLAEQETTVAFFGRDEGRAKTPPALVKAVERAGGTIGVEATVKGKELPRWLMAEAKKLGVELDAGGARELVAAVGERQQRLLRELETLAIEHGPGARLGEEEVAAVAARSAERQVWGLVDALVARDTQGALRAYLGLREQGEAIARLLPLMARRLREVLQVAVRLERGEGAAQIKDALKLPPWMADRRIREARGTDADALRRALEALARLEETSRGLGDASEETAAILAIEAIAA
jgi:DNA polymerase III subunit delta